jgi:hypothetical protein
MSATTTVKLNERYRDLIRARLIEQKFGKRITALEDYRRGLALKVYNAKFNEKERELMKNLPVGWLKRATTVKARLGGIDFASKLPPGISLPVPAECSSYQDETGFLIAQDTGPLAEEWRKLHREASDIEAEKRKLHLEIGTVLHSVTTANRLVTVWPEIKPVVDAVCKTYSVDHNLPAPRVADLNKALGLTK